MTDGHTYLSDAVAAGASAVITDIYNPTLSTTQVIHPRPEEIEGLLAATFHEFPSRRLFTVGITQNSNFVLLLQVDITFRFYLL